MSELKSNVDTLFDRVEQELWLRLTEGECEECGRSAATTNELAEIRRWIGEHGYVRPAYPEGEEKKPSALPHGQFAEPDTPHKARAGG